MAFQHLGLLGQVLTAKYAEHQPLCRRQEIYRRSEVEVPMPTLAGWVGHCGVALLPLMAALRQELLSQDVLHADETPVY